MSLSIAEVPGMQQLSLHLSLLSTKQPLITWMYLLQLLFQRLHSHSMGGFPSLLALLFCILFLCVMLTPDPFILTKGCVPLTSRDEESQEWKGMLEEWQQVMVFPRLRAWEPWSLCLKGNPGAPVPAAPRCPEQTCQCFQGKQV